MPISKDRISSPLEAGTSLLEMKQLPPQVTSALDYVSSRLARKRIHLSMIVIRKDINILPPSSSPESQTPSRAPSPSHSMTASPARALFSSASSSLTKSLSKHSSSSSLSDSGSSTTASTPSSARSRWPGLPSSPRDTRFRPSPPSSPTPQSASLSRPASPTMNPYGIELMQTTALTAKTEKTLRRTVFKAEKRFSIGSGWLSAEPLTSLPTCLPTLDLLAQSLAQNDALFTSEGLTLLALDHLYTFKSTLHTYSRTLSPADLTISVDSLRRLVLSRKGKKLHKSELMKAYAWLGVSLAALVDVNEGYKTAYGGKVRDGGIDMGFEDRSRGQCSPMGMGGPRFQGLPKLGLKTDFDVNELRKMRFNISGGSLKSSSSFTESSSPTTTSSKNAPEDESIGGTGEESPLDKEVEVGESAKGRDDWGMKRLLAQEDRGPHLRGPITPNGFEDITPVTKGEWCFLMVGEGWKGGRRGAVETC